ncbi:unnamed protein product [Cyprideis torosa]|uniref:Uncharacterized protein n=1 Tax=Cyprideis torosa TaxID=163714 RepID=A0A7R8WUB0_9CRUS|nr:unnamed protein product [Cyprideis torosa]CAG0906621.1 unnamed protein product [Cyprideis torosa]
MQYHVVLWTSTEQIGVVSDKEVLDKECLLDNEKVAMFLFGKEEHEAKILASFGKRKYAEQDADRRASEKTLAKLEDRIEKTVARVEDQVTESMSDVILDNVSSGVGTSEMQTLTSNFLSSSAKSDGLGKIEKKLEEGRIEKSEKMLVARIEKSEKTLAKLKDRIEKTVARVEDQVTEFMSDVVPDNVSSGVGTSEMQTLTSNFLSSSAKGKKCKKFPLELRKASAAILKECVGHVGHIGNRARWSTCPFLFEGNPALFKRVFKNEFFAQSKLS